MTSVRKDLAGSLALMHRCERVMSDGHALLVQANHLMARRVVLLKEATLLVADVIRAGRDFSDEATGA